MACIQCGPAAPGAARPCAACGGAGPPRRPPGPRLVLLTAALVLAVAGTGGGLLLARPAAGPAAGRPPAGAARRPAGVSLAGAAGRMSRTAGGPPGAGVAIAATARAQPGALAADAFLARYFAAINRHDYRGYLRLFGPGSARSLSAAGFRAGYATTRDSAETLAALAAAGPGQVAATVTFTSRQAPSASPAHAACVRWRITIYLLRRDGRYVIGNPPGGYRAADRAC
jgi:hypothetical protein